MLIYEDHEEEIKNQLTAYEVIQEMEEGKGNYNFDAWEELEKDTGWKCWIDMEDQGSDVWNDVKEYLVSDKDYIVSEYDFVVMIKEIKNA